MSRAQAMARGLRLGTGLGPDPGPRRQGARCAVESYLLQLPADHLRLLLASRRVEIERHILDPFKRTLVLVRINGQDVGRAMVSGLQCRGKGGMTGADPHRFGGRSRMPSHESRSALSRARFFLRKAQASKGDEREDFEAYLEAAIVFARAAIERLKTRHEKHPQFNSWWDSLKGEAAVLFFRRERNWLLKEAAPKIGQKLFPGTVGGPSGYVPIAADEFYYFESPDIPATATVERHLSALEAVVAAAVARFT